MKLVTAFNLSKVINVFVQFNWVRKHPDVFFSSTAASGFSLVADCCVCCSRWSLTKGLRSVMKMFWSKLSGVTENPDYFWSTDLLLLEWDVGQWKYKKNGSIQHRGEILFEGTVCWLITGGSPPLPVTVLMSFVLQFLDKVEVCLCLDQCLLNPLNYSMAYLSSWNLRKQISIQRMTLHLPPALFCCFKARWVASCEGTWWPTIR